MLLAQFDSGAILGTVRDANAGLVGDAKVTVRNIATGITSVAQTDANGDFIFPTLRIGLYKLTVEKQGFSTAVADNVNVFFHEPSGSFGSGGSQPPVIGAFENERS